MTFDKRERALLIILCSLLAISIGLLLLRAAHAVSVSDWLMVLFTAILTVATILMRWDMSRTLQETKRSVDTAVQSNRGVLAYYHAEISGDKLPFALMNIGSGPLFILEVAVRIVRVGTEGNESGFEFRNVKKSRLTLPTGGIISSNSGERITHVLAEVDNNIPPISDSAKTKVMAQFHAVYETIFGDHYVWRETKIFDVDKGTIMTVPDVFYTFDRKI